MQIHRPRSFLNVFALEVIKENHYKVQYKVDRQMGHDFCRLSTGRFSANLFHFRKGKVWEVTL